MRKTLSEIEAGRSRIVKGVEGNDKLRKHLESLGFIPGAMISVVTANNGNIIVNVKESRIAINKEMSDYILV